MFPLGKPAFGATPLPEPVIWDRIRDNKINPLNTLEGSKSYAGGGRVSPSTPPAPKVAQSPKGQWRIDTDSMSPGGRTYRIDLPSGIRTTVDVNKSKNADFVFYEPGSFIGTAAAPSTRQGITRFSDAFASMQDFVTKYRPNSVSFTALTDNHMKVYDKIAPMVASRLGGKLEVPFKGHYIIRLMKKKP